MKRKIGDNKIIQYSISIFVSIITGMIIAIGINVFLSPNGYLSTGFTGVALIFGRIYDKIFNTHYEIKITSVLYLLFNIPVLILAWKKLSKPFAIFSAINVITTSICSYILPENLNEILHLSVPNHISYLDAALFVGIMNGTANGLVLKAGSSTSGVDIVSMYYSIKKQSSIGRVMIILNVFILLAGIIVNGTVDGLKYAFYTLAYVITSSLAIDLFYGRNKRVLLFVITDKGKEISNVITHKFIRGVTVLDAKGAYTLQHHDYLYCACAIFEADNITKEILKMDEHAFISIVDARKVYGNFINKEIKK